MVAGKRASVAGVLMPWSRQRTGAAPVLSGPAGPEGQVMSRYLGPKVKLSRRVGVPIADIPKHTTEELTIPGMHGYRGRRSTEYGVRLTEKQKLRFHYGMLERQFRRFLTMARKSKGNTGNTLLQLLERRLDNVLRRLGVGRTIWACRQIVAHGHVLVDGRKTDIASYIVEPGQTITFKDGIHKMLRENMEGGSGHSVPPWLEFNPAQLTAQVKSIPNPEDVPFEVNMNLIVEFYR
jgi:small subunit ribosomal protein S4